MIHTFETIETPYQFHPQRLVDRKEGSMLWFEKRAQSWVWCHGHRVDDFVEFEQNVQQARALLKEVIRINKSAIGFFKRATDANVDWSCSGSGSYCTNIRLMDDFVLLLDDTLDAPILKTLEVEPGDDWIFEFPNYGSEIDDDDLYPKEVLFVKKDITSLIHSCISARIDSTKFDKLSEVQVMSGFLLDLPLVTSVPLQYSSTLRQVPTCISITKESDSAYIDEPLSHSSEFEAISMTFHVQAQKNLPSEKFHLEIIDLFDSPSRFNYVCSSPWKYDYMLSMTDDDYFESLDMHMSDESLEKGSIYKIDFPFMSNAPTFSEFGSAFEFAMDPFPSIITWNPLKALELKNILQVTGEGETMEEAITQFPSGASAISHSESLKKIRGTESFFIDHFLTEDLEYCEPVGSPVKEIFEESVTNNPVIQNSDIKIMELTRSEGQGMGTHETAHFDETVHDTAAATRMDSFGDDSKRRSLDDELNDIISAKKRKMPKLTSDLIFEVPLLNLLETDHIADEPTEVSQISNTSVNNEIEDPLMMHCDYTIFINSGKLSQNSRLLKHLDLTCELQVIEFELAESDPDFIISCNCAVLIIDSSTISQVNEEGSLKCQKTIIENKLKYPQFMILLTVNESFTAFEQLFNFQLSLSLMKIQSLITSSKIQSLCSEIINISFQEARRLQQTEIDLIESGDVKFLTSAGLNPFTAISALQRISLLEFISMSKEERSKSSDIPAVLNSYLEKLFSVTWDID